jgi:hypothetical protein
VRHHALDHGDRDPRFAGGVSHQEVVPPGGAGDGDGPAPGIPLGQRDARRGAREPRNAERQILVDDEHDPSFIRVGREIVADVVRGAGCQQDCTSGHKKQVGQGPAGTPSVQVGLLQVYRDGWRLKVPVRRSS